MTTTPNILIIGAGIAGLSAAHRLSVAGIPPLVLDKGRGVGGRMATRRAGEATFDHGAQYFSTKTPDFQAFVKEAASSDAVREWWPNLPDKLHLRWIGTSGMNAVPKFLAKNLTVLTGQKVVRLEEKPQGWEVFTAENERFEAKALLLTLPAPQAVELLSNSALSIPENDLAQLRRISYHPCLAMLATLNSPSKIPAPGGLPLEDGILSWVADNYQKGISQQPSVTLHASAAFSEKHLDADLNAAGLHMLEAAADWLPANNILDWQIHRWRYSLAAQRHPAPFLQAGTEQPLFFGGDGFGIGNVEGAFLSGLAMAEALL